MKPMKEKHKLKEARLYDAIDKCSTARMAVKREVSDMCPGGIQLFDCPGGIRYERKDEKYKEMYQYIDELFGW